MLCRICHGRPNYRSPSGVASAFSRSKDIRRPKIGRYIIATHILFSFQHSALPRFPRQEVVSFVNLTASISISTDCSSFIPTLSLNAPIWLRHHRRCFVRPRTRDFLAHTHTVGILFPISYGPLSTFYLSLPP